MKKVYKQPTMTVYGSVEEITQFFNPKVSSTDFLFFNGNATGQSGNGFKTNADTNCDPSKPFNSSTVCTYTPRNK